MVAGWTMLLSLNVFDAENWCDIPFDNYDFENGTPSGGDCDCFTSAALACAKARNIPARAVIVGNSSQAPTHIYAQLFDGSKFIDFDLVSSSYGTTKAYKNKQIIKLH